MPVHASRKLVGRTVVRIDRAFYETDGVIHPGDGPLEVQLDDGAVLLFDGGADGESLRVENSPWVDPFEGQLTPENAQFVAESGKWTRVPVSKDAPYCELIGATVEAVEVLENEFGREAGLGIETAARTLWFVVQCDEAHVHWASPRGYRARRRYSA